MNVIDNKQLGAKRLKGDLADHFVQCSKLGRYLTVQDNSRFLITDDFRIKSFVPSAAAIAAICSKDILVAQAALLPLSEGVEKMKSLQREKYERLFTLIEEEALVNVVKSSARALSNGHFRLAEIRALEVELGEKLSPARIRYREFLVIIKKLMEKKLTSSPFLDEFRDFTHEVAGKLDFGIYSFCLDRLFGSLRIPMKVKKLLVIELVKFPSLIRRELMTNILVFPGQKLELIDFCKYIIKTELKPAAAIEIELLGALKAEELTIDQIEKRLNT